MASRKTFSVDEYRARVNCTLATSNMPASYRQGLIDLLEHILQSSGNYRGFKYLGKDEMDEMIKDHSPGINTPIEDLSHEERFRDTDNTRRYYF